MSADQAFDFALPVSVDVSPDLAESSVLAVSDPAEAVSAFDVPDASDLACEVAPGSAVPEPAVFAGAVDPDALAALSAFPVSVVGALPAEALEDVSPAGAVAAFEDD